MKSALLVACVVLAAALCCPASAATWLSDNFDSYANQAALEAVWTPIGSGGSGVLSTAQAQSAPNSVLIDTTGTKRNRRTFADTTALGIGDKIVWSFDYYDSNAGLSPYRQYSNLQDTTAPSGTNQLIGMGLNNNQSSTANGGNYYMARILGHIPEDTGGSAGSYFKLNDFGVGLRSLGWHNLKVAMSSDDGLSTDYQFYVDGVLAELVSNVGTAAQIRSYDTVRLGSGLSNASTAAYYDNMLVRRVPVPEPATFTLVGLGFAGIMLAGRRRSA